jgi:hypothetical protein
VLIMKVNGSAPSRKCRLILILGDKRKHSSMEVNSDGDRPAQRARGVYEVENSPAISGNHQEGNEVVVKKKRN